MKQGMLIYRNRRSGEKIEEQSVQEILQKLIENGLMSPNGN